MFDKDDLKSYHSYYGAMRVPSKYRMPKAISSVDPKTIRNIQSFHTNVLSYLYTALSESKSDVGFNDSLLDHYAKMMFTILSDSNTKRRTKEYLYSKIHSKKKYNELFAKVLRAKKRVEQIQGMVSAAEKIVATASREQTWRQMEFEKAYGRGGQGTG